MRICDNPKVTNFINKPNVRQFISQMSNHNALLPVIMLETTVISGRTFQAYKRGGITEARERIIDETFTAVVWFGIISWLNKGFGKLIESTKLFNKKGLPEINIDFGKDIIRNPLKRAIKKRPEIKNIVGGLKVTKIAASALAGIYLSGLVLPKFYQNMTKNILCKEKLQENNKSPKIEMGVFLEKISSKPKTQSFGNLAANINTFAHVLENNPIAKLLTVDVGLFAGRGYSARNRDERTEILFRDCSSSFFYMFCTPLIFNLLSNKLDKFKGKNTSLDPNTVDFVTKQISNLLNSRKDSAMPIEEFEKLVLGGNDKLVAHLITKINKNASANPQFSNINDVAMRYDKFEKIITQLVPDKAVRESILANARKFIDLRPKGASKTLLTASEMINSVDGGLINNATFLTRAVEISTMEKVFRFPFSKKPAQYVSISQNPDKFISFREIDKIKINIKKYAESILEYAKSEGKQMITQDLLIKAKNRNSIMKVGYTLAGMLVSATFLSTIIPKLQYKITEMRTGERKFPGIRDIK